MNSWHQLFLPDWQRWEVTVRGFERLNSVSLGDTVHRIIKRWYHRPDYSRLGERELLCDNGEWWVIGYNGDEPKTFRVNVVARGTKQLRISFQQVTF